MLKRLNCTSFSIINSAVYILENRKLCNKRERFCSICILSFTKYLSDKIIMILSRVNISSAILMIINQSLSYIVKKPAINQLVTWSSG